MKVGKKEAIGEEKKAEVVGKKKRGIARGEGGEWLTGSGGGG